MKKEAVLMKLLERNFNIIKIKKDAEAKKERERVSERFRSCCNIFLFLL